MPLVTTLGRSGPWPPIESLIAQRPPLLLIDEILEYAPGAIGARRSVRADDPVLAGHFPGMPIVPGTYLLEMMAQASAALARLDRGSLATERPRPGRMAGIEKARFLKEVVPESELRIESRRTVSVGRLSRYEARALVGSAQVAEGVLILFAAE